MTQKNAWIIGLATLFSFCTLYATQPLLPLLASEFGVQTSDAALLVTVTLIPLGIAPLIYGYFLQAIPAKTMLCVSMALLACSQIAIFFVASFGQMLAIRLIQGFIMPAIFTSLMTYSASMAPANGIKRAMSIYVAVTILGGCSSRILAGYVATEFGWRWVFVVLGAVLFLMVPMVLRITADAKVDFTRLDRTAIRRAIEKPFFRFSYLSLALVFFTFGGVLNLLPFRLADISASINVQNISLLYLGYLVGIPIALGSEKISERLGSDKRNLLLGVVLLLVGMSLFTALSYSGLFLMLLVMATGIFLMHATLSGMVNDRSSEHKGIVNGIYVSVYYLSGALGSWLPALLYQSVSWNLLLSAWAVLLIAALFAVNRIDPALQVPRSA
ncbi:MAG: MFS transporter [Pseudomonadota bacterium]